MKSIYTVLFAIVMIGAYMGCNEPDDDEIINEPPIANPPTEQVTPTLSFQPISIVEGNENKSIEISVKLSATFDQEVSVEYATESGSAVTNEDFEPLNGNLIFQPNELEQTISVYILSDTIFEEDESFSILFSNPVNVLVPENSISITLLNDDEEAPPPYDGYVSPLSYPGFELVWQEEFSEIEINPDHWNHEIGNSGWGNNESQNYTARADNSYIEEGKLIIEAKEENFGGSNYTSARLISATRKEFQYGRIDVRAKLPEGQGIWPAIWMLGNNIWTEGWPSCGEIDIMELVGHEPSTVHGTVHWDSNGNYANYGGSTNLSSGKFSDEFHVFSIIWDDVSIRWLLDNEEYHVIDIQPDHLSEFHNEFFFILNVAVGGNWPGYPDNTTIFPQKMFVDYIRVFQE